MSPEPPPLNPSQTVERIREIIVGRHLERLEKRIARLEAPAASSPAPPLEDRLLASEARLEALSENARHIAESAREEARQRHFLHQEEIHRMAGQIQQIAATRTSENISPAITQLEQKLGRWLITWRDAFQHHLDEREKQLGSRLEKELGALRDDSRQRIETLRQHLPDRAEIDERFLRIAAAARALADCAAASISAPVDSLR